VDGERAEENLNVGDAKVAGTTLEEVGEKRGGKEREKLFQR